MRPKMSMADTCACSGSLGYACRRTSTASSPAPIRMPATRMADQRPGSRSASTSGASASSVRMLPSARAARTRTSGTGSSMARISALVASWLPMRPSFSAASARAHQRRLDSRPR